MAAPRLKVKYLDGKTVEFIAPARAQVAAERFHGGFRPEIRMEFGYFLAWATLHPGKDPAEFETWLDTVEDCDEAEEQVDPTPETQSPTPSSD